MSGVGQALAGTRARWLALGNGRAEWDGPVHPEPPFEPFAGHGIPIPEEGAADDGVRETLLSRMARAASAFWGEAPQQPPFQTRPEATVRESLPGGEPPEWLEDDRDELAHFAWLLPRDGEWDPSSWERLIVPLCAASGPVCMEVTATGGTVAMGWAVVPEDATVLADAAESAGTAVEPQADPVEAWTEGRGGGYLRNFELVLAEDFVLPIQASPEEDPLGPLVAALSRTGSDDLAVAQVLFSPCRNPWAESLWQCSSDGKGRPFPGSGTAVLRAARSKCSSPLLACCVRVAFLSSGDGEDCSDRALASLAAFAGANGFEAARRPELDAADEVSDILSRSFRRSGMILNARELYALAHPPAATVGARSLRRVTLRTHEAPNAARGGGGLLLGTNEHAGSSREVRLSPSERLRHVHVIGASGTGKSTFLLNCMERDLEAGRGFALLDPHGDLADAVLDLLPPGRKSDLVLFDPSDSEFPVGFNILRAHTDAEKNLLASDFVAIFERLSTSWGDQMSAVLGNAALAILESERGGTLLDLKRFLIEKPFRDRLLETVADPEVVYFWRREFPLLRGTTQGSLLTRLSGFLRHRLVRNMVSQDGAALDVARLMDEGKVVIAPLAQGLIGQENSWLLGSLLVSRFHQAALSRQSVGQDERKPFFLYLDEAHNFVTPSIAAILSGARKYGLGLVLAHQELDQFPSREGGTLSSILGNCHTRICFRLGDRDADRLEQGFSHFGAEDLRSLPTGRAVCRIGGSDSDFSLTVPPSSVPAEGHRGIRDEAISLSRSRYARPRAEVEEATSAQRPEATARKSREEPNRKEAPPARDREPREKEVSLQDESQKTPPPSAPEAEAGPVPATPDAESEPRLPGRGGREHRRLQQLIKAHANGLGLRATVEAELPHRSGCVDVLVEGEAFRAAFEIAESSPLEQEVRNVRKCVEQGIAEIYVVSSSAAHLGAIRAAAIEQLGEESVSGARFISPGEIGDAFAEIGARLAGTQTESRGYRVKVKYSAPKGDVRDARSREVHRAASEARDTGGEAER